MENWKLKMAVSFIDDKNMSCYLCGDIINETVVKVFSDRPNLLVLDMLCFEQLTALGIKSIYNLTLGNKES